jgi:hypothetical protein
LPGTLVQGYVYRMKGVPGAVKVKVHVLVPVFGRRSWGWKLWVTRWGWQALTTHGWTTVVRRGHAGSQAEANRDWKAELRRIFRDIEKPWLGR